MKYIIAEAPTTTTKHPKKSMLYEINSRLNIAEETNGKLEDLAIETIEIKQRGEKTEKNEYQ